MMKFAINEFLKIGRTNYKIIEVVTNDGLFIYTLVDKMGETIKLDESEMVKIKRTNLVMTINAIYENEVLSEKEIEVEVERLLNDFKNKYA
jgi:hypothetical protein